MDKPIYYDVTELMTVRDSEFRMYGIARVVLEVAKSFFTHYPDTVFVFHSTDHDRFFQAFPESVEAGHRVDFRLPEVRAIRYRARAYRWNARTLLTKLLSPLGRYINLRRWAGYDGVLEEVDMSGGVFHSSARPKLIANMLTTIERRMTNLSVVPLLYDLIPLHNIGGIESPSFAGNFYFDVRYVIEKSDYLMAISQFTADDIQAFSAAGHFPMPSRVVAVPLVHEFLESGDAPELALPDAPYFLMVGPMLGHKNLEVVLNAYRDYLSKRADVPKLVLAGFIRAAIRHALRSERYRAIAPYVALVDRPNETDLKRLYENSTALIIASRIEGWGLPAGEAMWLGTPVLCARVPVLAEVCGDLGLYFGVDDPRALADHMTALLDDTGAREALRERLRAARPQLRTWDTVAREIQAALTDSGSPRRP